MSLEGNSILNGIGQNAEGRAFVSIAVNGQAIGSQLFGVRAVTKDGRELQPFGGGRPGYVGSMGAEQFEFPVPLPSVAKFIIGTRPIRTVEWTNVVLPGNSASGQTVSRPADLSDLKTRFAATIWFHRHTPAPTRSNPPRPPAFVFYSCGQA